MEPNAQVIVPKTQLNNETPVIDFTKQELDPSTSYWISTCKAVRETMEKYGHFIAVYDKVGSELRDGIFSLVKDLFDLPTEIKSLNTSDNPYFGYIGKVAGDQLYESFGFGDSTTTEAVQSFANLMCPPENAHFCETVHSYTKQVSELDKLVTRMLFESYGADKYYDSHIESTSYLLRLNGYRVKQNNERSVLGAMPHTDASLISILQQNEVQGLEVLSKDGAWFSVNFPPSSFVVMAGDALLAWSNGRINPCTHRVTLTGKESRYSIGLFSYHNGIVQVPYQPADDDKCPLKFKPFDHLGYYYFHVKNLAISAEERIKAYCGIQNAIV